MSEISAYHNNDWNGRHGDKATPRLADQEKWEAFLKDFLSPDTNGVVEMVEQLNGEPLIKITVESDLDLGMMLDPMAGAKFYAGDDVLDPMALERADFSDIDGVLDPMAMETGFRAQYKEGIPMNVIYIGNPHMSTPIEGIVVQQFDIGMIEEEAFAQGPLMEAIHSDYEMLGERRPLHLWILEVMLLQFNLIQTMKAFL